MNSALLSATSEILGWKNLASQRKIAKTIMVYKSLGGLAPDRGALTKN